VESTILIASVCVLVLACAAPQKGGKAETTGQTPASGMALVSAAFGDGELIPRKNSLYGENVSPELDWDKAPAGAKSFVHWVLFNIPDTVKRLPEGLGRDSTLPFGGTQGTNSFRRVGYDGPKPPSGTHRYYFDLYALDEMLELDQTATAGQLQQAMKGHGLAHASLMGKYKR
jgi:Raf kinase inhibitor-like YbhB/YbcL family protein